MSIHLVSIEVCIERIATALIELQGPIPGDLDLEPKNKASQIMWHY